MGIFFINLSLAWLSASLFPYIIGFYFYVSTQTHFSLLLNDTFLLSPSLGDLPHIHSSPFFFANKFYLNEDQIVYTCLEQRLFNQTRDLHLGRLVVNTTLYEESIIVKHGLQESEKKMRTHPKGEWWVVELMKSRQPSQRKAMEAILKRQKMKMRKMLRRKQKITELIPTGASTE